MWSCRHSVYRERNSPARTGGSAPNGDQGGRVPPAKTTCTHVSLGSLVAPQLQFMYWIILIDGGAGWAPVRNGCYNILAATTMSNLPCELLDHIVELLHNGGIPLGDCCLVSKSWVARTRRHLFSEVVFQTAKSLEPWKTTFPDPATSPARYTKTLPSVVPQYSGLCM